MEAGEYGLTRGTRFVVHRLEVVTVARRLWISWCGAAGFRVFFSFFFLNAHGLLQVWGRLSSFTSLLVMPGTQLLTSAFVEISLPLAPLSLMIHDNARDFLLRHFHDVRDGALRIILVIGNTGAIKGAKSGDVEEHSASIHTHRYVVLLKSRSSGPSLRHLEYANM